MNYLFAGKNGVFETLMVAAVYLGRDDIEQLPGFADMEKEALGKPILFHSDQSGNNFYIIGAKNYYLIPRISHEIAKTAGQVSPLLKVITITVPGEAVTWYLSRMAIILPLVGGLFKSLARSWALSRKQQIIEQGRNMVKEIPLKTSGMAAAKPLS